MMAVYDGANEIIRRQVKQGTADLSASASHGADWQELARPGCGHGGGGEGTHGATMEAASARTRPQVTLAR